jgi:sensor c-di-GMP phosphodiesterase-like protein
VKRWRSLMLAVAVVGIGTAVPLAATLMASWRLAVESRQAALEGRAAHAIAHAEAVYAEAATALRAIDRTDFSPCSPAHIQRLREITRMSLAVDNLAYGAGEIVECNAFGLVMQRQPLAAIDTTAPDGIGLSVNWVLGESGGRPTLIMRLDGHHALVDQRRFVGPVDNGDVIELSTASGLRLVTAHGTAGMGSPGRQMDPPAPLDTDGLRATVLSPHWIVIAHTPPLGFLAHLEAQRALLLPLALVLALLFGAASVWVLRQRLSPRGELAAAVRHREFIAHYQPIMELSTGRCLGAEALVRWRRPDGELERPDLFIPLAEETGLILPITDQMIAAIIADLGPVLRADPFLHVAINICADDLSSGRVLGVLARQLSGTGIAPRQIWLEATERGFVDIDGTHATLVEARRRGHLVAIDDFGTGYSGLKYLQRLPVDALKIDKSFVDSLGTQAPTCHVTEHILAMARELHLTVVAEGVERPEQAAFLRERGVEMAQGWLFARAMPAPDFRAFCRANRAQFGEPCKVIPFAAE